VYRPVYKVFIPLQSTLSPDLLIHRISTQLSTSGGTSRSACTNSTHNTITAVWLRRSGRAFVKR
jgi:hypothetical protein